MNFLIESSRTCFKKSFTFKGRASLSEYWYFFCFQWIAIFITVFIMACIMRLIAEFLPSTISNSEELPMSIAIIFFLMLLILFPANISVLVRRLHDINRSGWWIPVIVVGVSLTKLFPLIGELCTFIGWSLIFYWCIKPSYSHENQYGLPPHK